jgi:hypothetical protein
MIQSMPPAMRLLAPMKTPERNVLQRLAAVEKIS